MDSCLKMFLKNLQDREIIAKIANSEKFINLEKEEKIVYLGIDTTAESLHIGHLFLLIQSFRFAKEGFRVLLVLGGATSRIGDPSDKLKERTQIEFKNLIKFKEKIKNQLERIIFLDYSWEKIDFLPLEHFFSENSSLLIKIHQILGIDKEETIEKKWFKFFRLIFPLPHFRTKILNNEEWLKDLTLIEFIDKIAKHISVNQLLAKEIIKQRIANKKVGFSLSAFLYSTLQAFDFYILHETQGCQGQLGGSDQWGNLTIGLELIKKIGSKNNKTFAITFNLLTDKDGKKLSKSENSKTLRLDDSRNDFFDFFRNMPDEQAEIFLKQFTFLELEQVNKIIELNSSNKKMRIPQWILLELIWFINFKEILKKHELNFKKQ